MNFLENLILKDRSKQKLFAFMEIAKNISTLSYDEKYKVGSIIITNDFREICSIGYNGNYHHFVDSFHVYERHFKMLEKLRNDDSYFTVNCPKISGPDEVKFLKNQNYKTMKPSSNFEFTKWLIE